MSSKVVDLFKKKEEISDQEFTDHWQHLSTCFDEYLEMWLDGVYEDPDSYPVNMRIVLEEIKDFNPTKGVIMLTDGNTTITLCSAEYSEDFFDEEVEIEDEDKEE